MPISVIAFIVAGLLCYLVSRLLRKNAFAVVALSIVPTYVALEVVIFVLVFNSACLFVTATPKQRPHAEISTYIPSQLEASCNSICLSILLEANYQFVDIYMDPAVADVADGWIPDDVEPGYYRLSLNTVGAPACAAFERWQATKIDVNTTTMSPLTMEIRERMAAENKCISVSAVGDMGRSLREIYFHSTMDTPIGELRVVGTAYQFAPGDRAYPQKTAFRAHYALSPNLPVAKFIVLLIGGGELVCQGPRILLRENFPPKTESAGSG